MAAPIWRLQVRGRLEMQAICSISDCAQLPRSQPFGTQNVAARRATCCGFAVTHCRHSPAGGGDFGPKYQAHVGELQRQLDEARAALEVRCAAGCGGLCSMHGPVLVGCSSCMKPHIG